VENALEELPRIRPNGLEIDRSVEQACSIAGGIYEVVVKRCNIELKATNRTAPYGWGMCLEEGEQVPVFITAMANGVVVAVAVGVTAACFALVSTQGWNVFSMAAVRLCS
jgi:hypothetical protein